MNEANTNQAVDASDEMPEEFLLDHSKATPNRFASRLPRGRVVGVVLEPDVAEVFPTSDAVNQFLRSVIAAMPRRTSSVSAAED